LRQAPEGITLLFSTRFSTATQAAASSAVSEYHVTKAQAIEELRRLLAIKAFTADNSAEKISSNPLRVELFSFFLFSCFRRLWE
jgi:hypothetical protein